MDRDRHLAKDFLRLLPSSATTFNTFVDAARDYLLRQQGMGSKPTLTPHPRSRPTAARHQGSEIKFPISCFRGPLFESVSQRLDSGGARDTGCVARVFSLPRSVGLATDRLGSCRMVQDCFIYRNRSRICRQQRGGGVIRPVCGDAVGEEGEG